MNDWDGPIAIGGIGGSGTRVGAKLLTTLGFYIGGDLNDPLDNLWFTLLFKRRSILVETADEFHRLKDLFWRRMSGSLEIGPADERRLLALAGESRIQHDRAWLRERVESFLKQTEVRPRQRWGWKEPNTQIVIDRLLAAKPELKYIHFLRHPLDMALSANQNQLENWGPIFLDRPVDINARESLTYWVRAHRRMVQVQQAFPGRVLMVDFDRLCEKPEDRCTEIAKFAGSPVDEETSSSFAALIDVGRAGRGRFKGLDLGAFDPADLNYVQELGYPLARP